MSRLIRIALALTLAGSVSACFQPMYGDRGPDGGPGLRSSLAGVNIAEIPGTPGSPQARLAVELQNEIDFALRGGSSPSPPTHRLEVVLNTGTSSLIVDPTTARAEYEIVAVEATYKLIEIATKKVVFTANASSRTSYNAPGQQQRFAMLAGQRNAQSRATKVVAEQIRDRLASYFAAKT